MAAKIRVRKNTQIKSWLVFMNSKTRRLEATEDKLDGHLWDTPEHLKCIGCPVAASANDAINYVEQVLGPIKLAEWWEIWTTE